MDVIKLLEYLQDIIETSSPVPLTGKVMVNRKEVLNVISEIINNLPDELKKAQWMCEERERILNDAIREAEIIKEKSINNLKKQIENHDILREANYKANSIITSAEENSKMMKNSAKDYADSLLNELEKQVDVKGEEMLSNLKIHLNEFLNSVESDIKSSKKIIKQNIKDLRNMK